MQYCYVETFDQLSPLTPKPTYKLPLICSDYLYDLVPSDATRRTILEGSSEGYNSINDFKDAIIERIRFNPCTVTHTTMLLNSTALDFDPCMEYLKAFGAEMQEYNQNMALNLVRNEVTYTLALNFFSSPVVIATNQSWGGYNPMSPNYPVTGYAIYRYDNLGIAHINHSIYINPEQLIESNVFDFSHYFPPADTSLGDDYHRACMLNIDIWKNNDKWFFIVTLSGSDMDYAGSIAALEGQDTGHVYNPSNPYDDGQGEGTEGGGGGFDKDSDPTPIPDLPSIDITAAGGLKLYKLSNTDLAALITYLNSHTPGEAVLKMWQNPIQAVLACYYLPYPVTANGAAEVTVLGMSTGVAAYTAKPWQQWDMGSVFVDYTFGENFLDFEPYTTCQIYLPFVGIRRLNMDEVVGHNVRVVYQFDNTSGACVAYVMVGNSVKYSYAGSCAVGIPLTQENWGQTYIAAATAAAGALAGGISGASAAVAEGASKLGIGVQAAAGAVQGGGGLSALNAKPTVSRSGSVCGAASALAYPSPYLIIEYPDKAKVANPAPVTGLACGRTLSLGSLSGYNIIEHVHLKDIAATGPELEEIEQLLYQGVVF